MKQLPFFVGLVALFVIGACRDSRSTETAGGRAQSIAKVQSNPFVGVWSSPPTQTVNHWYVAFTVDGLVAVNGPGVKADGTYQTEGNVAKSHYLHRDGRTLTDADGRLTIFELSADGQALTFSTGIPMDPPVTLVRSGGQQSKGSYNPFSLAML
ncbi:MAG: hypothetical protein ACAH95_09190 [Fimbriimonas sp.]